jgi:hypothetical protein
MRAFQRPRRRARRAAVVTLAVAALLISACADSGYHYLKNTDDETGAYFKVPDAWKIYDENAVLKRLSLSPARARVEKATSWTVAFDANSKPTLKHFEQVVTDKPFGVAKVRELEPEERESFSLETMRNLAVSGIEEAAQQGDVEVLRSDEFTESGGFRGLRFTFNIRDPESSRFVTFDQVSVVDPGTTKLYFLVISCSASCYQREKGTIDTVLDSWTVKELT